jgi:hypothetical protein
MAKAKKHDHDGALDDYTAVIELPDAPSDVRAMALYNRALVHVAAGDHARGTTDLDEVLAMEGAPDSVKSMARQKLAQRESRARKTSA